MCGAHIYRFFFSHYNVYARDESRAGPEAERMNFFLKTLI